jgi:hypothetical protein
VKENPKSDGSDNADMVRGPAQGSSVGASGDAQSRADR